MTSMTPSIVAVLGSSSALDALSVDEAVACRVAPDEHLLVGRNAAGPLLVAEAQAQLADPDALVVDVTDGWAGWSLRGDATREAFAHLCSIELPAQGFEQGDVAGVPVKILAGRNEVDVLVPAMWSEHLRTRILQRCGSLGVTEVVR
jgi:sarcosine oxidase gamma subunit